MKLTRRFLLWWYQAGCAEMKKIVAEVKANEFATRDLLSLSNKNIQKRLERIKGGQKMLNENVFDLFKRIEELEQKEK